MLWSSLSGAKHHMAEQCRVWSLFMHFSVEIWLVSCKLCLCGANYSIITKYDVLSGHVTMLLYLIGRLLLQLVWSHSTIWLIWVGEVCGMLGWHSAGFPHCHVTPRLQSHWLGCYSGGMHEECWCWYSCECVIVFQRWVGPEGCLFCPLPSAAGCSHLLLWTLWGFWLWTADLIKQTTLGCDLWEVTSKSHLCADN